MIEFKDLAPSAPFPAQLQGPDDGQPVTLVNTFLAPEGQVDKVVDVWRQDSLIMKVQPGFASAQFPPAARQKARPDPRSSAV
ncbi:hypothetical protein ACFYXC_12795 [Streptomyces sp. NPDC002701]|uniref:hypothetical protein n=1 Tax=Streptomyces sp. NPDC002701 TaxID=3364661 RepID=UPI0036B5B60B